VPSIRFPWPCLFVLLLPLAAVARPASYALDPVHTRVLFAVSHAGFSNALGTVSGSTGTLVFDPDDWTTAQLQVSIPIAQFDLGDAKWNRAVGVRSLLDVQGHPVATFTSTRIEPKDPTHATVCGTLQLRGVEHEACLDVTFNQLKRHPLPPFHRTAGFSATATLSRKAFGITAWPSVIGDNVELRIEAEAIRSGRSDADDTAPVPVEPEAPIPVEPEAPVPASTQTPAPDPTSVPVPVPAPEPTPTTP